MGINDQMEWLNEGLSKIRQLASRVNLPPKLLIPEKKPARVFDETQYQVFRNACPRNCYDTCSIKTYVRDGVVEFIEGDGGSSYTDGGLCVKGYSYPRRQYSPDRIKYPMIQDKRGSGKWRRISWDRAMDIIAKKILEIKDKDGSLLGLALSKLSGHHGVTNHAVEGMMSSLGYTTRFVGTPCWPAGIDAQTYDMGDIWCNDPEDMSEAKYIILWGVNPAWCAVHSMKYIMAARQRGAKIVSIDPVFTQTSAKSDEYWQPHPGTDGALALGMARHILDQGLTDADFVSENTVGFDAFSTYLRDHIGVEWAAEKTGIPADRIRAVAEEFAQASPGTIWIGYGLQRHTNGGATVRAIDALVAMCGHIGKVGGGARYAHLRTWGFNYHAETQSPPEGSVGVPGNTEPGPGYSDRHLNINKTARSILEADDPKIRMLWVSCRNVFAQDFDRNLMEKAFEKLELVVSVEQFFTETVKYSDLVLPVTTLFEEFSVNVSYWHYWLAINEAAVKPMYEAKSNLEIAALLSRKINELRPGSCTFPQQADDREWTIKEFNPDLLEAFGLESWETLRSGPVKMKMDSSAGWHDNRFMTPSGKYEFASELCARDGYDALPVFKEGRKAYDKYRLLTPHSKFGIHSQFNNLDWVASFNKEPYVYIHPTLAQHKGISDLDRIRVFNALGTLTAKVKVSRNVPEKTILMYEAWFKDFDFNVNTLVDDREADMGSKKTGAPGVALHDQFADIEKV
ncbi:MAG: molybdopterin-dependent oxidoreductase [Desulfobacterales bacterium]|nr:molybdopterin-dependent oxidoreductase [Desulfobacterales bacterium]